MIDEKNILIADHMQVLLRQSVRAAGGVVKFCQRHRLSPGTINAATQGVRPVPAKVARVLGYEPMRVYRRITRNAS